MIRRVLDAGVVNIVWIFFERFELGQKPLRDFRAAHRDESFDLIHIPNRHDARDDRDVDAHSSAIISESQEVAVVEKQLRHDRAGAIIHLLFQMFEIACEVQALWMAFGKARAGDELLAV